MMEPRLEAWLWSMAAFYAAAYFAYSNMVRRVDEEKRANKCARQRLLPYYRHTPVLNLILLAATAG
jgi:hypothetical protein